MSDTYKLEAQPRETIGTPAARRLRREGLIPAVLYGHQQETKALAIPSDQFQRLIRTGARGLMDLDIAGQSESVVIKEVQWDAFGIEVLHIDFNRVSKHEKVVSEVKVALHGVAPGVAEGGVLDQQLHTIEVEAPAAKLPEEIEVNINELKIGDSILIRDLAVGDSVKLLAELDQVVVQVVEASTEADEETDDGPAQPEVIAKGEKEDEGE